MANTSSAEKALRVSARRKVVNSKSAPKADHRQYSMSQRKHDALIDSLVSTVENLHLSK